MSSAPTSTTSSGGNVSPRLSRMSSSSGSFSSQSLQGFRTVSLPGLFPGTHLGILASGLLDKRRDGAVRGGWAKRLFILSTRSLHYYRKVEESELFGKERGQVLLSDIGYSKVVTPEEAPAGAVEPGYPSYFVAVLSKRKTLLLFLRADSLENVEELEKTPSEAPMDDMPSPVLSRPTPTVLVVSMISVLSDGEELQIPQRLLGDVKQLLSSTKQIELTTPPRSQALRPNIVSMSKITVSFRCVHAPPVPISRRESGPQPVMSSLPSTFSIAFPGTLGGLFLISCLVSFYCASPFEGLMKITIVLGLVLSVSQITQFVVCLSGAQNGNRLSPVMSPIGAASRGLGASGNEFHFYLMVDKIEVIEADQDKDHGLPATLSPGTASVDGSVDTEITETLAISGGPIAFSPRFIAGEKGDVEKGRQRYLNTLEWRKENNIDDILVTPHPNFEIIKKYYPQYFHGRTRDGLPVYYERPGKIDLPALKREGLSIDDLLRHYMYMTEYLWRVVEPNDSGRSITVLDVTGIGMYDLGGEVLDFIKRASAFTGAHYPERSAHIFIINIPGWFNMIWRMVKPLIDPVTRDKVHMLKGSAILRELETFIDMESIPSDFGGEGVALGDSSEEHALAAHVNKYL
ncbi:hypothetical protein PHYBOEH_003581 [Phytophthora boehmeriae]|uniref:CRAL-TRIO domain-containing protein n=1 Tax=Phytophthora boehmeriae TaxID=109152 RepID=A0A8T1X5R1_9STRA|nr:hypothetical protein PHYBOEH_003581 [Phytophthora boehmeriae]